MKRPLRIEEMDRGQLLAFDPNDMVRALTTEELVHIANVLGASWFYDYEALEAGRPGMHAELKSGRHSDGFFVSRILLDPENIRRLVVAQMAMLLKAVMLKEGKGNSPTHVVGVPKGATVLGEGVGAALGLEVLKMHKTDQGQFVVASPIGATACILVVEDICTTGKGFFIAIQALQEVQPKASFFPYDPVIINRGGLSSFCVKGVGGFTVLSLANIEISDWDVENGEECPLCKRGSEPVKPKATNANWQLITTAQLAQ